MLLKNWLKLNKIRQRDFAKTLGKKDSYVSLLCNPRHHMQCSVEVAVRIEEITGGKVTARDLVKKINGDEVAGVNE